VRAEGEESGDRGRLKKRREEADWRE